MPICCRYLSAPTFSEFVSFLIDSAADVGSYNEHWIPVHLLCLPCNVKYDFIAKTETLSRDSARVLDMINIAGQLGLPEEHKTPKIQSANLTRKYFSQLTKEQVRRLYEIYRLDFKLFGYDSAIYSDYAT